MLTPRAATAIALLALAIAAPQLAQAQANPTCPSATPAQQTVCNVEENRGTEAVVGAFGGGGGRIRQVANRFNTGNSPNGYLLRSVHIDIDRSLDPIGEIQVTIRNNDNFGKPGSLRGTLSGPARPLAGFHAFTGSIPLYRNTIYFVAVSSPDDTDTSRGYRLEITESGAEAGDAGWSIGDVFWRRYTTGGDQTWQTHPHSALRFAVVADINAPKGITDKHGPEPLRFDEDPASQHQYTLRLNAPPSEPNANVIITPRADPSGTVTFDKTQVTFNINNWRNPQVIKVFATEDAIANPGGLRGATIRHAISGDDSAYNAFAGPTIAVFVIDDGDVDGPPLTPTDITATAGSGHVTLNWTKPLEKDSPITRYEICALEAFVEANCTGDALTAINAAATGGVVTGLTNGTAYTLAVRAVNARGNGAFSASVTATPDTPLSSCPAATASRQTICNINRFPDSTAFVSRQSAVLHAEIANSFTTGDNPDGYTLRSVRFEIREITGNPDNIEVRIHNANGNIPGSLRDTLSGTSRPGTGYREHTGDIMLESETTYFLVWSVPSTGGGNNVTYRISGTFDTHQTGSADTGWRIGDRHQEKVGSGAWSEGSPSNLVVRFAVIADVIPPAGVTAAHGPEPLTINESGTASSATYTLVLDAPPRANVTVVAEASPDGVVEFARTAGAPFTSMTQVDFTPDNWREAQTIIVRGANDDIDNPGDQRTATISHSITSSDSGYGALDPADDLPIIRVTIIDDDAPPVSCPTPPGTQVHACNLGEDAVAAPASVGYEAAGSGFRQQVANAFTTGAATAGYLLQSVRVNFGRVIGNPANLRVTIHAQSGDTVGDEVGVLSGGNPPDDGPRDFTASGITLRGETTYYLVLSAPNAPSGDNRYRVRLTNAEQAASSGWSIGDSAIRQTGSNAFAPISDANALHFGVLAEPIVGIIASTDTLAIDEAGANNEGEYTLVLDTAPSADVVIMPTIEPRGVAALSTTRLTFTAANWDTPSTITVTAVDDDIDNNPGDQRTATITHTVAGASEYAALARDSMPQIELTIADDDDAPGISTPDIPTMADAPALRLKLRLFLESALP